MALHGRAVPPSFLGLAAHEVRWRLLTELAAGDLRVRELVALLGQPQNLVSYHLRLLRAGGLVTSRRSSFDGRDSYYRLDLERCAQGLAAAGAALALGAEVTAADSDLDMLEVAARHHPHASVRLAALPDLPFADAEFDAVAGNFVINHVPDTPRALAELHRVLRPGGRLALSWWKAGEVTATDVFTQAIAAAGIPYEPPARPFTPHEEPSAFLPLLGEAGFAGAGVSTLRWRHRVDLGAWWDDIVAAGGPRFRVIAEQPPATVRRIRDAYDLLAAPYAADGFPVCAYLAHATR
ncbi:methyltransferase domain-containing protein [Nonomuraea sp. NN258]|uniref:ArsR/SmtB family transcription factor n=1 Tax=Nonomuraea antri TaxID=2730852 RepID=UPI001568B645|nr:methyltransferase domain-containing protein [Nonomuraea antri]NRQ36065.1 methyltransferase domain-containing protein [Nonomuraea antri]